MNNSEKTLRSWGVVPLDKAADICLKMLVTNIINYTSRAKRRDPTKNEVFSKLKDELARSPIWSHIQQKCGNHWSSHLEKMLRAQLAIYLVKLHANHLKY